jgi:hypothetical protein
MTTELFVLALIGLVAAVYAGIALRAYFRLRGTRVVVCPETHKPVAVKVDAAHAAATAIWEKPDLTLKACTRWPERKDCDQGCTAQIAAAPEETLAFQIARKWFADKNCALCRRRIAELQHSGPKPGLLSTASPTHDIIVWDDIPAEALQAAFETHLPVCPSCQVAEAFRRQFPELIVDRKPHDNPGVSVH